MSVSLFVCLMIQWKHTFGIRLKVQNCTDCDSTTTGIPGAEYRKGVMRKIRLPPVLVWQVTYWQYCDDT